MPADHEIPETRVLAVASHVVYGYVGNTMATFVMQSLGCEVSAINTVHYSNHLGYRQAKGTKTSAGQILDLYEGLRQSHLNDFDVLLTGYMPSAEDVEAVGKIGRELKLNSSSKPGSFFWVLDPVMGDNGRLYTPEDEVLQYKSILCEADLILPNQFEAELLSDTKITSLDSLCAAIKTLHRTYNIPHVIITSLQFTADNKISQSGSSETLTIVGSTACSDSSTPRLFRIDVPALPTFFSGTGDMFAALTVARLREAVFAADLQNTRSWVSPDAVPATSLPLARAVEKVLASMQSVLRKTLEVCGREMAAYKKEEGGREMAAYKKEEEEEERAGPAENETESERNEKEKRRHLRKTKATEIRVVRNVQDLISPPELENFRCVEVVLSGNGA